MSDAGSGYRHCACRDCMEIAIGDAGAFCWACEEAGCETESGCCSPDAYGGEFDEPFETDDVEETTCE